jgi:hypothetical protein
VRIRSIRFFVWGIPFATKVRKVENKVFLNGKDPLKMRREKNLIHLFSNLLVAKVIPLSP